MKPNRCLKKNIVDKTFTDYVVELSWARSGGRCECTKKSHKHLASRCIQRLDKHCRGKDLPTAWQAHKINPNAPPVLRNCKILCRQCYLKIKRSSSYAGRDRN